MGRVCSVKKNKNNAWSAIIVSNYYLVLFSFASYVSREMGSNKEMKLKWFL